jgi:hypothetical protein
MTDSKDHKSPHDKPKSPPASPAAVKTDELTPEQLDDIAAGGGGLSAPTGPLPPRG